MRAQTVNFERGKDPRSSMDIGLVKSMRQKFEDLKNDYRIRETWMDHWQGKDCLSVSYDIIHGWNPAYEAVKENLGMEWFEPGKGKDSNLSGVRNFFVKPEYLYLFKPSTNESVNFERGLDPKESLGIGNISRRKFKDWKELTEWIAKNLYYILEVPENQTQEYYEDALKGGGGMIPTSIFAEINEFFNEDGRFYVDGKRIDTNNMKFSAGKFRVNDIKYSWTAYLKSLLEEKGWKVIRKIEENINFERGQNPKTSLNIGVIRSITSDDLSLLGFGWLYDEQRFDEEEFKREYNFAGDTPEEKSETLDRAKTVAKALEDQIVMHYPFYDWKEEDEFNEFLKSGPYPEYPYIYDAVPPMDEWRPVFSKVELPNAEEIEV